MKKNNQNGNTFIVLFPLITFIFLYINSLFFKHIKTGKFPVAIYLLMVAYFAIFFLFLYFFIIKKVHYTKISLIIGSILIILLQIPQMILNLSYSFKEILFGDSILTGYVLNAIFVVYLILAIKKNNEEELVELSNK